MCQHQDRAEKAHKRYTNALWDALTERDEVGRLTALAVLHTLDWVFGPGPHFTSAEPTEWKTFELMPPEPEQQLAICSLPHAEAADAACHT